MRDSAIFYRSFYEAIKELPTEKQAEVYTAVFEYALNFKTVELTGISKMVFTLIKPQIDANIKRFRNGSKAKGKRIRSESEAKPKQNAGESEANNNVNNNANVYDNINNNEKDNNHNKNNTCKPSLSSFSFSDFWESYNKKTGLTRCESLWKELSNEDKRLIKERLPAYIKATESEIAFRKDPYTWLIGKHWLDEHVPVAKKLPVKSAFEMLMETGRYE